ncbi:MAG TPA: MMPL family transporter [Gaiellaceae bacterium]
MKRRDGFIERLARICAAHPWRILMIWGSAVIAALVLSMTALGGLTSDGHVSGKPESTKAGDLIDKAFPPTPAELKRQVSDVIVVHSDRYRVDAPQYRAFVANLARESKATGKVRNLRSYLTDGRTLVSRDAHATVVQILVDTDAAIKPVVSLVKKMNGQAGFEVAITGDHTVGNDFGAVSQHDLEQGELALGLPAALIILLVVFGAVVAGLVPLLMALVSIAVGMGIVSLLSLQFDFSVFIVNMLTGMGLALGIDYSLFVLSRYREERAAGAAKEAAISVAGATASRAVTFSGGTFVIALFGMFLVPTSVMRSLAAGAIIVGVVSVAAALTLLPALLGLLGDRVNALRVPFFGRELDRVESAEGRLWQRIVGTVLRRPALSLLLAAGAMLAIATPTLGLHVGENGVNTLPNRLPSKQGYVALQREFPAQSPYPARIVVEDGGASTRAKLVKLEKKLAADPRFAPGAIISSPVRKDVLLLDVPVRGDVSSGAAISALRDLRAKVIPGLFRGSGATVYVGGRTALYSDYFDAVTNPTPLVLALVLGLSFILLTVAFRSIVVALVSIVLNLLSVGAAYGVLTLVFLHGFGAGLFGFQHVPVIDAWVPLFLFSVLFGLSMDYQVFLVSRIRERFDHTGSTRDAASEGVASTARIITGAALIIIAVFSGFANGEMVAFQQMGFGVAVALFLDATVVRSVVLPSVLSLFGDRAWYLPRWLDWLPRIEVSRHPQPRLAPENAS